MLIFCFPFRFYSRFAFALHIDFVPVTDAETRHDSSCDADGLPNLLNGPGLIDADGYMNVRVLFETLCLPTANVPFDTKFTPIVFCGSFWSACVSTPIRWIKKCNSTSLNPRFSAWCYHILAYAFRRRYSNTKRCL